MSKANRKKMYDKCVAENTLYKDDGALVKEFGEPATVEIKPVETKKKGKK